LPQLRSQGKQDAVDIDGLIKFAQDIGIEPTDPKMLIIAWKFGVSPLRCHLCLTVDLLGVPIYCSY
jgi:hypothetical protein